MKKQLLLAATVCASVIMPSQAIAANFTNLYVFGDSLSDTGNLGTLPDLLGYSNGRISNGPNWVDYFGNKLGVTPTPVIQVLTGTQPTTGINFAFTGATSGSDNILFSVLPGLLPGSSVLEPGELGLAAFTNTIYPFDPNGLYVVWAGANDYLDTQDPAYAPNPQTTVINIATSIGVLHSWGARNFLIPNLPDLGKTPYALGFDSSSPVSAAQLSELTFVHNIMLAEGVKILGTLLNDVQLTYLDVYSLFNVAGQFGFTNSTDACRTVAPPEGCNSYVFWDDVHPTTAAHSLLGEFAFQAIQAQQPATPTLKSQALQIQIPETQSPATVPESTPIAGVIGMGAIGAILLRKRKQPTEAH